MTRHIRSSDPRILTRKCCDRLRSVGAYWVVSQRPLCSPIYELTAGWRGTEGNNRILRFEPASSTHSVAFNPLDEIRLGTDHETGDMQNLATLIVDPD